MSVHEKIKTIRQLSRIIQKLKKQGKKVVHCHGVFDLVHPGHIRHFASAKQHGDVLVVTITGDKYVKKGPGRPIFREELRAEFLAAIAIVDFVGINHSDSAIDAIKKLAPHVYIKGPDYKNRKPDAKIPRKLGEEEAAVKSVGGVLLYTDDDIVFSSSHLINSYLDVYPSATRRYLGTLKKKYTDTDVIAQLTALRDLKVLVIGDAIIDEYHYCVPMGKSSKEPLVVHNYKGKEVFAGGTLASANHVVGLCNTVHLVSMLGKTRTYEAFIRRRLKEGIAPKFFYQPNISTIIKRRYLDYHTKQKVFQISYMKDELISEKLESSIVSYLREVIHGYDLVIVNDYGHGLLTKRVIKVVCDNAKYLALNVQANSANYGFNVVTKYPRADYVCIDSHELRLATHDKYSDIELLMKKVFRSLAIKHMVVTKGQYGSVTYTKHDGQFLIAPALTDRVVDRVGAGDALFAITAPCVAAGMDKELVSFVGNVAGALSVQIVGNRSSVEFRDLTRFITRLLK